MIPCIVHIEICAVIKILIIILQDRLMNSKGQLSGHLNHMNFESKREDSYCEAMSNMLNVKILRNSNNK